VSDAASLSETGPPPVTPIDGRREPRFLRRAGYRHGRRAGAALLFLVAFVLAGVAVGTPWWTESVSGHGATISQSFFPGTEVLLTCVQSNAGPGVCGNTNTVDTTYQATGYNATGAIYAGIEYLLAGALAVALAAAVLGLLGAFGLNFGRRQLTLTLLLGILAFVLLLAAPTWAAAGQPAALQADGATGHGQPAGPTSSFWGANTTGGVSWTWGADVGWYCAVGAAALLLVGLLLLLDSRRDPYTYREIARAMAPVPATTPAPGDDVYGAAAAATSVPCLVCGSNNPADAWVCWKCQRPLR
jgi:hypothetical protein